MKEGIHPTYYEKVTVRCSCGHSWETGSTSKELAVEVCSACHPFYTGKRKLVDVAGRIDKFKKRLETATQLQTSHLTNRAVPRKKSSPRTRKIKRSKA